MSTFESLSHSKWESKYHVVFIPKGRKKSLYGKIRKFLGPVFHELAGQSAQKLLEDLDKWLSANDRDTNPNVNGTGRYCSGLGIYYFEEPFKKKD